MGFTWRFMRRVSRLLMFAPARWIAQQYSISYSAVLRIDREILRTTQPEPCWMALRAF